MSKSSKYSSEVETIERDYNIDLGASDEETVANSTPLIRKTVILVLAGALIAGIAAYLAHSAALFLPVFIAVFAVVNSHRIEKTRRETEALIISLKKEIADLQDEKEEAPPAKEEVAEIPVIDSVE